MAGSNIRKIGQSKRTFDLFYLSIVFPSSKNRSIGHRQHRRNIVSKSHTHLIIHKATYKALPNLPRVHSLLAREWETFWFRSFSVLAGTRYILPRSSSIFVSVYGSSTKRLPRVSLRISYAGLFSLFCSVLLPQPRSCDWLIDWLIDCWIELLCRSPHRFDSPRFIHTIPNRLKLD